MNKMKCKACILQTNCNIHNVLDTQIDSGHSVVIREFYKKGDYINLKTQESWGRYLVVKTGALCAYLIDSNDTLLAFNYYFHNDIVNLYGIFSNCDKIIIKAVSDTRVCHVRISEQYYDDIDNEFIHKHTMLVNSEIRNNIERCFIVSQKSIIKRISYFIANMSIRGMRVGLSGLEFSLPFSLLEFSAYLQTNHEKTLESILMMIEGGKFILIKGRVKIIDEEWLRQMIKSTPFSISD